MGGTSKSVLLFVRAEPVVDTLKNYAEDPQSSMKNGTLKVDPVSFCITRYPAMHTTLYVTINILLVVSRVNLTT